MDREIPDRSPPDKLKAAFPDHHFLAEESFCESNSDSYDMKPGYTWCIDPIDGTSNFAHALPFTCVVIALFHLSSADAQTETLFGLVHNPILNETFIGVKGLGSFVVRDELSCEPQSALPSDLPSFVQTLLSTMPHIAPASSSSNTLAVHRQVQKLAVSAVDKLNQSLLLIEFGYDRSAEGIRQITTRLDRMLSGAVDGTPIQTIRSLGTCALDLCSIAVGRADAYFEGRSQEIGPKPWDSAAAALILVEAGGLVVDLDGKPYSPFVGRLAAASTRPLLEQLLESIKL